MGGAAGHMAHPFDLPEVNTGNDLINFFKEAAEYLTINPASVKIDGVNVSFKLIDGPRGKEFAVDRGSTKPIDIEGITLGRVGERFPEGHGMRPAITTLLSIFNKALPNIQNELQKLGMWEDPTIFLNTEYVTKGKTNVQEYDKNFLAIHGVNQFYEKTNVRTGAQRPGAERPFGNKAPSAEISYNDEVFNSLIEKVSPIAAEFDFDIYGSVPTESVTSADFSSTLDAQFPVNYGYDEEGKLFSDTKSLGQWLNEANNPRGAYVALTNGKKVGALSKFIYTEILNGTPMTELLATGDEFWDSIKKGTPLEGTDVEKAVDGAVFYHTTRMLGNDVLKTLTSPMGPVESHEGAVVRGISSVPVKITGEFILGGLQTGFREHKELNEQVEQKRHLALIPGGFKPPHKGHLEMIKFYYKNVGPGGKVIVLMGSGGKQPRTISGRSITLQDSMDIWEIYLRNDPAIDWPSDRVQFQNVEGAGPIAPIIDYVREQADPETEVIHLGAGEKDAGRWKMMMDSPKNNPRGVEIRIAPAPNLFDAQGNPLSASAMRKAVEEKDLETFKNYIPDTSLHMAEDIYVKLSGALLMEEKEDRPLPLGIFLRLIEEVINENTVPSAHVSQGNYTAKIWNDEALKAANKNEDEELEEASSMAGGNVEGAMTKSPFPGLNVAAENEKEAKRSHTLEEDGLVEEKEVYRSLQERLPTAAPEVGPVNWRLAHSYEERAKKIGSQTKDDLLKSYTDPKGAHRQAWLKHVDPKTYDTKILPAITKSTKEISTSLVDPILTPEGESYWKTIGGTYTPKQKSPIHGQADIPAYIDVKHTLPYEKLGHVSGHEHEHHTDHQKKLVDLLKQHSKILKMGPYERSRSKTLSDLQKDALSRIVNIDEEGAYAKHVKAGKTWRSGHEKRHIKWRLKPSEIRSDAMDMRKLFYKELGRDLTKKDLSNLCSGRGQSTFGDAFNRGEIDEKEFFDQQKAYKLFFKTPFGAVINCKDVNSTYNDYKTIVQTEPAQKPTRMVAEQKNDELIEEVMNYLLHKNGAI